MADDATGSGAALTIFWKMNYLFCFSFQWLRKLTHKYWYQKGFMITFFPLAWSVWQLSLFMTSYFY